MKKILVLFDFTETAVIAINHAIKMANAEATIYLLHITPHLTAELKEVLLNNISGYTKEISNHKIPFEIKIESGKLFNEAPKIVEQMKPDLVIAGSHGIHGIKQNLFGSSIYKMVHSLPVPTLVVSDHSLPPNGGYKNILFPVAPHDDFLLKAEQTSRVLAPGGKINIFAIKKPGVDLDDKIRTNIEQTENYFKKHNISFEYREIPSEEFSVGFSRQTLKYAQDEKMDLISIMAKISTINSHFGKLDKENTLLNETGIPILCTNA